MIKRSWSFRCINGKGGAVIFDRDVDAETALYECRLSIGPKVVKVY